MLHFTYFTLATSLKLRHLNYSTRITLIEPNPFSTLLKLHNFQYFTLTASILSSPLQRCDRFENCTVMPSAECPLELGQSLGENNPVYTRPHQPIHSFNQTKPN